MPVLILLPLLAFGAAFLSILAKARSGSQPDWRLSFIQASVLSGAFLAVSSELLSLVGQLTRPGVAVAWLCALVATLAVGWRNIRRPVALRRLFRTGFSLGLFGATAAVGFATVIGLLLVVAVISPPNNTDSLQYHMARVVHWAQNASLRHYATGFAPQLLNPTWAEMAILHFRLLWGDDRLANLVQWLSMLGTLVGVTYLAKLLGARREGQWAAAAFGLSIPMGLLQSTSTQNDYVVAFWLICLLCLAVLGTARPPTRTEWLSFALALGLGLLTKGTFYPYALPVLVWVFIAGARCRGLRFATRRAIAFASVAIVLNLGYFLRNMDTFGGPLGSPDWIRGMTTQNLSPVGLVSSSVRNLALNFASPFDEMNEAIAQTLRSVFGRYDPSFAGFGLTWAWNHEDLAGNPLHVILAGLSLLAAFLLRKRLVGGPFLAYSVMAAALFATLSFVVKPDPWGVRYQLGAWVAWSPLFGIVAEQLDRRRLASIAIYGLILFSVPYALLNRTRPLIGMRDVPERLTIPCEWGLGCSIGSILLEPKTTVLFANWTAVRTPYILLSAHLKSLNCREVGLRIDSHDPEYLFWWLLEAPQSGMRIETLYPVPELQRLLDRQFEPCAVVCTICGDRTELHGLPLLGDYEAVKLFGGEGYSPIP